MKDITQIVFDDVYRLCLSLGYGVYDYLPGKVGYPFIYLGEQFEQPILTKSPYIDIGTTQLTIHVFGLSKKRKVTTDLMQTVKTMLMGTRFESFSVSDINTKLMQEQPDKTETLLHGVLTVDFSYQKIERGN